MKGKAMAAVEEATERTVLTVSAWKEDTAVLATRREQAGLWGLG